MYSYKYNTPQQSPYHIFDGQLQGNHVIDLVLCKKSEKISGISNKEFLNSVKKALESYQDPALQNQKKLKVFTHLEKRGDYKDFELNSVFVAIDEKSYAKFSESKQELPQKLIAALSDSKDQYLTSELKNLETVFENDEIKDSISQKFEEKDVLESLFTQDLQIASNKIFNTNSSFDGQSSDTEDSTIKKAGQENMELRQEIQRLREQLRQSEQQKKTEQREKDNANQQYFQNMQLLMEQKNIMENMQNELNMLHSENQYLKKQELAQKSDIQLLSQQIAELQNNSGKEQQLAKNLDEKNHQLNKFVTWFLIQENKGKCFSQDKVKQRTWECQEFIKETLIKKELREILQLK